MYKNDLLGILNFNITIIFILLYLFGFIHYNE